MAFATGKVIFLGMENDNRRVSRNDDTRDHAVKWKIQVQLVG